MRLLFIIISMTHHLIDTQGSSYGYMSTFEALVNDKNSLCLGDCAGIKGREVCVYDWGGYSAQCSILLNPHHDAPKLTRKYRTIDNEPCYSNCGPFQDKGYDWCVTNVANSLDWNYCTRKIALTGKKAYRTSDKYLTCTDECTSRTYSYNWCNTIKKWQYCDPAKKVIVFDFLTESGKKCATPCELDGNAPYCYDTNGDWKKCYLNPQSRNELTRMSIHMKESMAPGEYTMVQNSTGYMLCRRQDKRDLHFNHPLNVEDIAREYEDNFPTIDERYLDPNHIITDDRNPVLSYTVHNTYSHFGDDQINLPLVIRAIITNHTLRRPGEREDFPSFITNHFNEMYPISVDMNVGDDKGHLVASMLGGPTETFNIFPQFWRHNRGTLSRWAYMEADLYRFINTNPNSYAEYTVVVSYDLLDIDRPYRPTAVGLRLRLYNGRGELCDIAGNPISIANNVLENMYFTNNPDFSCIIEGDQVEDRY